MYDVVPMPSGQYGPYMSESILQGTTFSITVQLPLCGAVLTDIADMRASLCRPDADGIHDMSVDYGGNRLRWHNCIVSRIEARMDANEGTALTLVDLEVYSADAGPGMNDRVSALEPSDPSGEGWANPGDSV